MQGQINLDSSFGKLINMLARSSTSIVEIGTWNGQGSTRCVIDALISRTDDYEFYTVECNQERYHEALNYWASTLTAEQLSKIHFLFGSILERGEIPLVEEISNSPGFVLDWYNQDLSAISTSGYVFAELPLKIDMLILDGGEYTTYAEFLKLKDRSKIICLDDTATNKCKLIREQLLDDPTYICVTDITNDRNGYAVFRKI